MSTRNLDSRWRYPPDLGSLLMYGAEVYADRTGRGANAQGFGELNQPPQRIYDLLTDIEGRVLFMLGMRNRDGVEPSFVTPLDLVLVPMAIGTAIRSLGAKAVHTLVTLARRRSAKAAGEAVRELTQGAVALESGVLHSVQVGGFGEPGSVFAMVEMDQGKVLLRVKAIILKAEGSEAEKLARAAYRDVMKRAAQEAQKRGQKEFTLRGIDANANFQAHANKLASEVGVPDSAKVLAGSARGYTSYEVTLDAAKVLNSAARRDAARAAAQGVRAAASAAGGQAGHVTGRLSAQEMERYLLDVLAKRPDLRRLMAARVRTGEKLREEVLAILKEWEFAQNWSVKYVNQGVAQQASGRSGNFLWLNKAERTLYIERQVVQDPAKFLSEVRHELVAHAVGGGGGHGSAVAFIEMANGQAWNAQVILKLALERGDLKAAVKFFSGG